LLAGTPETQDTFCRSIKERGYAILSCDKESVQDAANTWVEALQQYFQLSEDEKRKNCDKDNNNIGFVKCEDREYIKVAKLIPDSSKKVAS
jgi:hypothetical protein